MLFGQDFGFDYDAALVAGSEDQVLKNQNKLGSQHNQIKLYISGLRTLDPDRNNIYVLILFIHIFLCFLIFLGSNQNPAE